MASMMAEVFTGAKEHNACWQDREIRFDAAKADLELRKGEFIIDILVRASYILSIFILRLIPG